MGRSSSSSSSGGGGYGYGPGSPDLPPGFRFHPTDEELVVHYLRNQALSRPCPVSIIPELNIYKYDPWELPARSDFGEGGEWYFFSPRDRKYPNGARPNRATASGYWKATGTDKAIYHDGRYVGVKKALVFYKGKPPRGAKSEWIMHEYRLGGAPGEMAAKMQQQQQNRKKGSMRLDDWVLCRIYQKKHQKRPEDDLAPNYSYDYMAAAAATPSPTQTAAVAAAEDSPCQYYLQADASPPASIYDYEEHHMQQQQQHQTQQPLRCDLALPAAVEQQTQPLSLRFPRSCSLAHLMEAEYMSVTQMLDECGSGDNFHAIASSLEREADQFLRFDDDAAAALFQC